MVRKLALAALTLLCMPAMALAGTIYASTPTTSPVRGTISPVGYVFAPNTGTTPFTVTPKTGYMIGSVTVNGAQVAPSSVVGSSAVYQVQNQGATQKVVASFVAATTPTLTAKLSNPLNTTPNANLTILGNASTVILPTGTTATYTWSVDPAGPTLTPASGQTTSSTFNTTFSSSTPGVYVVTLKLTAAGLPDSTATTSVVVQSPAAVDSQACTSCHTSQYVAYAGSIHATNSNVAVSCQSCHNPGMALPHPGYATSATIAPQCLGCHSGTILQAPHFSAGNADKALFGQFTATGIRPSYVTANNSCATCHYAHNPLPLTVQQQWAENAHANTLPTTGNGGTAWGAPQVDASGNLKAPGTDFKFRGAAAGVTYTNSLTPSKAGVSDECVRCHTTTGFINFATSGYVNIQPWGTVGDKTREVLTCGACHTDAVGTVRTLNSWTAYVGYSTTVVTRSGTSEVPTKLAFALPVNSLGKSNTCASCHSHGRNKAQISGELVKRLNAFDSYSVVRVNVTVAGGHGQAIAAVPFLTNNTYVYKFSGQSYDLGSHSMVGVADLQGTGTGGPCAGCHLGTDKTSPKGGHTFEAWKNFSSSSAGLQSKATCNNCHNFNPMSTAILTNAKYGAFAAQTSVKRVLRMNLGLAATKSLSPSSTNPIRFYTGAAGGTGDFSYANRADLQGANLNSSFPNNSWWLHGPILAKELLFDSLDMALHGHLTGNISDLQNHVANGYLTQDQVNKTLLWFNPFGGTTRPRPF